MILFFLAWNEIILNIIILLCMRNRSLRDRNRIGNRRKSSGIFCLSFLLLRSVWLIKLIHFILFSEFLYCFIEFSIYVFILVWKLLKLIERRSILCLIIRSSWLLRIIYLFFFHISHYLIFWTIYPFYHILVCNFILFGTFCPIIFSLF